MSFKLYRKLMEESEYKFQGLSKIGYGMRNKNTHELLKLFSLNHSYTEMKEWNATHEEEIKSGEWIETTELEEDGKRKFKFWNSDKIYDTPQGEKDTRKHLMKLSH